METARLGFEFFTQMEFLWHMRMARNDYALAANGGNVFWIDGDIEIGRVVRHTGGGKCEIGFDDSGIFTYGVIVDRDTEVNRAMVKILGECRVFCTDFAQVGMYAEAQTDGSIKPRWLKDIENPQAIIGVCASKTVGGFCKMVIGPGRECAQTSPISGNFLWQSGKIGGHSIFAAATITLPNVKVSGPFCVGFKPEGLIDPYDRIKLEFTDKFFKEPPMVFTSMVNTAQLYHVSAVSEPEKLHLEIFRGGEKIKPRTIEDAQLNIICMGVTK